MIAVHSQARLGAEELADLGYWLREHGVPVDPRQLIAAARLLGALPEQPPLSKLSVWLAPIFSTCASEQDAFPGLYVGWLKQRHPDAAKDALPPPGTRPGHGTITGDPQPGWLRRNLAALLMIVAIALACFGAWHVSTHQVEVRVIREGKVLKDAAVTASDPDVTVTRSPDGNATLVFRRWQLPFTVTVTHASHTDGRKLLAKEISVVDARPVIEVTLVPPPPAPPPPDKPSVPSEIGQRIALVPAPALQQDPDIPGQPRVHTDLASILMCVFIVAGTLAWWVFASLRRRGFLERLPGDGEDAAQLIAATVSTALVAYRSDLRYLSREMRRRRQVPSRALDVSATLAATLRNGLMTKLVFGTRAEPEYLVLVDRTSPADHLAQLADDMLAVLLAQGVSLERYEFEGDPRFAYHASLGNRSLHPGPSNLGQLAARHAGARLIVFSDGEGLVDRYTGKAAPWLRELSEWPSAVLMTPVPRAMWSLREQVLNRAGVTIVPFEASGLHLLGDAYRQDRPLPSFSESTAGCPQPAYLRDEDVLLDGYGLPQASVDALLADLKRDLGEDGFAWLAGCAVYPEIHWGITLAVGDSVLGRGHGSSQARSRPEYPVLLTRLSRLPWMRHGYMPDWLRTLLLRQISPAAEARIRQDLAVLFDALSGLAGEPPGKHALRVVTRQQNPWRDALSGLKSLWHRRPVPRLREDRIFLKFMSGPQPRLAVAVTEGLMRLLYRRSLKLAGPRLLPLSLAAVAAVAIILFRPQPMILQPVAPGGVVQPAPAFLSLDETGTRLLSVSSGGGTVGISALGSGKPVSAACRLAPPGLAMLPFAGEFAPYFQRQADQVMVIPVASGCRSSVEQGAAELRMATRYTAGRLETEALVPSADLPQALCLRWQLGTLTVLSAEFIQAHLLEPGEKAAACVVSGNGARLLVATQQGRLRGFALAGASPAPEPGMPLPPDGLVQTLATDDTGEAVAVLQPNGSVWVRLRGASAWRPVDASQARQPLAMAGDGLTVAFANAALEVEVWKLSPEEGRKFLIIVDETTVSAERDSRPVEPKLAQLASTLYKRYGYQLWDPDKEVMRAEDKMIVVLDFRLASRSEMTDALVQLAEEAREEAPARQVLTTLLKPKGMADLPYAGHGSPNSNRQLGRWLLQLDQPRFERLSEQLATIPEAMDLDTLMRRVAAASGVRASSENGWARPWPAAGHSGGSFVMRPLSPPVKYVPPTEPAPPLPPPPAADADISPLVLGWFADGAYYLRKPLVIKFHESGLGTVTVPAGFVSSVEGTPIPKQGGFTEMNGNAAIVMLDYLQWSKSVPPDRIERMFVLALQAMQLGERRATEIARQQIAFYQEKLYENAPVRRDDGPRILSGTPPPSMTWAAFKDDPANRRVEGTAAAGK